VATHSNVTHKKNHAQLQFMLQSPLGAVAKDLIKRGARVESRAKRNLSGGVSGPRRINTGHLRSSISHQLIVRPEGLAVRVGTSVYYARWVHDGTGIYGPRHTLIKPKLGKVLVWKSRIYGAKKGKWAGKVVVRSVKGMRPNPFLANALPAFKT
jgi:hypothetical protein